MPLTTGCDEAVETGAPGVHGCWGFVIVFTSSRILQDFGKYVLRGCASATARQRVYLNNISGRLKLLVFAACDVTPIIQGGLNN